MYTFGGYEYSFVKEKLEKAHEQKKVPFDHLGLILEDNQSRHCKYGMIFGNSVKAVLRNNNFEDVDTEFVGLDEGKRIDLLKE